MIIIRQGDILLQQVNSLPKKIKKLNKNVLAYGEVTGHSHRFEVDSVVTYADDEDNKYVDVLENAMLVHEEHNHLEIPAGKYKVIRQREYDPKANRLVVD